MEQREGIFEGLVGSDRRSWSPVQMQRRTTILLIRVLDTVRVVLPPQPVGQIDPLLSSRGSQLPAVSLPR